MTAMRWTATAGGDWSLPTNWSAGAVPTSADDVVVDLAGTYQTTISGAASALSLTLNAAGATVVDNGSLTLGGPLSITAGLFQLGATGALSFGANPGLVNVAGLGAFQTLGTRTLDNIQVNLGSSFSAFAMFTAADLTLGANAVVAFNGNGNGAAPDLGEFTGTTLNNNGMIEAVQNGGSGIVYFTNINNAGTMLNASASGYTIEGDNIVNTGTISSTNPGGIGISGFTSFINSGTIVDNGGVGVSSPNLVNNGTINIGGTNSYLSIDSPLGTPTAPSVGFTTTGTGTINVNGAGDTLQFVENQTLGSGTINLTGAGDLFSVVSSATNAPTGSAPATLTLAAGVTVNQTAGTATFSQSTPLATGNALVNDGSINASAYGGTLTSSIASFVDNGVIAVSNGDHLVMQSALTGTGQITLAAGATAEFSGADAATVAVKFLDGAADVLKIDATASFASGVNGFAVGDTINLAGVVATGATWANNVLTVQENGGATLSLNVNGAYAGATFHTASDGAGGTNITLTPATVAPFHWASPVSGSWATGADWTGGVAPGAADAAVIDAAGTYAVTVGAAASAGSLTLNAAGASLNDVAGLSVSGALSVAAGTVNLGGAAGTTLAAASLDNAGSIIATVALAPPLPGGAVGQTDLYFVSVAGAMTNSGTLSSTAANGVLAEMLVTASSVTNTGAVLSAGFVELNSLGNVTNNGTFTTTANNGIGVSAPNFVNNGQINIAGGNDDLEITSAYPGGAFATPTTISGTGAITLSGAGSRVRFIGTQTFAQGTINVTGAGATLTDASVGVLPLPTSALTFGAQSTINVSAAGSDITSWYNATNEVINDGAINVSAAGASLTIDPANFANNGTIALAGGDSLALKAAISGTGTISLASGASVELFAGVAAGQTAMFLDGAADKLKLDAATSFAGAISGFAQGDTIDLAGIAATGATWANNVLTIAESNGTTLALSLLGNYGATSFAVGSDGALGSNVTIGATVGKLSGAFTLSSVPEDAAVAGTIATFADTNPADAAAGFTATIAWGDGTTSAGVVSGANGAFSVTPAGSHAYGAEGAYVASVLITRAADGAQLSLGRMVTATEADALAVASAPKISAVAGQAMSGSTLATFSNSNPAATAADFSATVAWGDGTTSAGVVNVVNGVISASGSHTYASQGTDTVTVTLRDVDGTATATATGSAIVSTPSSGATYTLTTGVDHVTGTAGDDTIVAATNTLSKGDVIDAGAGVDTLRLTGGGTFNLGLPTTLASVEILEAQEGAGTAFETVTLRAGVNLDVRVANGAARSGIKIVGANDASVIHLGAGADTVTLGAATETALGGGGADVFNVIAKTIGATIDGGTGASKLVVSGGGKAAMGANITNIHDVILASSGSAYDFTANATAGLVVNDLSAGNADYLHAGAAGQLLEGGTGDQTFFGFGSGGTAYGDTAAHFNGANIRNFSAGDLIDVQGLAFAPGVAAQFDLSGAGAGDLNVMSNGAVATQIHILGLFNSSSFAAMSDGHGGTVIYDTATPPHLAGSLV